MYFIMINGSPRGYFSAHRGLRQGDPLSSFLLTIVGEALHRMLLVAGEPNLISGFLPAASVPMVTRLQFADDTIIFCVAEKEQVKNAVAILRCFEAISGLKVNLGKSELIGVAVEESFLQYLARIMGCRVGSLPTSYLGLPLTTGSVSKSLWNPVVERVELNLAS